MPDPLENAGSEPPSPTLAELRAAQEEFIRLWGQMASKWGIARTMAEVHALLFVEGRPLNTDDVMERLSISRGNASMTLRALVDWGIVHRTHLPGDRKEYFTAEQDVWKLFRTVARERKKREIDPLIIALHDCRERSGELHSRKAPEAEAIHEHNARLDDLIEFMHLVEQISQRFISPTGKGLEVAAKILAKVG